MWQLTSTISARIGDDATLGDVFTALFPSGSVTGAPKRRTMEIIVDLEESMRGVYCGAIGYVAPSEAAGPRAAFNVAIRTVVIDTEEGTAEYGVGGGITWDSLTAAEYQEARAKAQLLVERRPEFGLIETLLWSSDEGWFWRERHLERLVSSARYFGFLCDVDAVNAAMEASVDGATTTQRVRLVLGRGGELEVSADPLPVVMRAVPQRSADVLRFELSGDPVASDNTFVFHKTTRRGMYDDQLKAHPRADDVLLVNERGEITEFTIGNVVVCFGDRWVTPPLDSGCLPGVMRAELLAAGQVAEEIIEVADLDHADSIWFVNSVRGWRAAERISQNGW